MLLIGGFILILIGVLADLIGVNRRLLEEIIDIKESQNRTPEKNETQDE